MNFIGEVTLIITFIYDNINKKIRLIYREANMSKNVSRKLYNGNYNEDLIEDRNIIKRMCSYG